MKFTIQKNKLIESVQDVMKAISSRVAIPILTGLKIEAHAHGIILTGSDSDISIESFIPKEEDNQVNIGDITEGAIILQAKYFSEIVRKLPEDKVEIETDDHLQVTIRSGKAKFNLNGQNADEYPHLPKPQTDHSLEISASILKDMIKKTVFAVSTMETRPILTGVHVQLGNQKLIFTATDSHRLAVREVHLDNVNVEELNVVIPGKSLNELNKILENTEEKIEISVTNNQILFKAKHLNFLSRILDGNYPETSRLIPDQSKTVIYIKTKELLDTIDRASLLAREEHNNVVRLTTKGSNIIEIIGNSPEIGNVTEDITVQSIEGEELKISFSSKYIMDALKATEAEEVKIDFTGAMRPFIIRPLNEESNLQLILPVRTY